METRSSSIDSILEGCSDLLSMTDLPLDIVRLQSTLKEILDCKQHEPPYALTWKNCKILDLSYSLSR